MGTLLLRLMLPSCCLSLTCVYVQYGPIEEMNVCDNLGDHLVGNVYIKASIFLVPVLLFLIAT